MTFLRASLHEIIALSSLMIRRKIGINTLYHSVIFVATLYLSMFIIWFLELCFYESCHSCYYAFCLGQLVLKYKMDLISLHKMKDLEKIYLYSPIFSSECFKYKNVWPSIPSFHPFVILQSVGYLKMFLEKRFLFKINASYFWWRFF